MSQLHRSRRRSFIRPRYLAVSAGAAALAIVLATGPGGAAGASAGSAAAHGGSSGVLPPVANSAWAYDNGTAGAWASTISGYNASATAGHELTQLFSYATDMEMYCPHNKAADCTPSDLQSYYTPTSSGWASTLAYYKALDSSGSADHVSLSPIIDGRTDAGGYLTEFNQLSPALARTYANQVAAQVCADPRIDGIQFDIEPFDMTSKNGQYYFFGQIAKDFATGRYGCVSSAHPRGRYFSVFTFASSIQPGTASAANVSAIVSAHHNMYVIDSLYDLGTNPAGWLNDLPVYRNLVTQQADDMKTWADQQGIPYAFGIPAAASAHEYQTCTGSCHAGANGSTGNPMLSYSKDAVAAIDHSGAPADRLFHGTSIWAFTDSISSEGATVTPAPAPANVLHYLARKLPG
jgi:hypothetical protein